MPVLVVCPNPECGASLSMLPDDVGQMVDCEKCGTTFEMVGETRAHEAGVTSGFGDSWPEGPTPTDLPSPFGRYKILKKLGQGGMGAVYLAQDTTLGRPVALKVPNFHPGSGTEVIERFRREAQTAAGFHHPNFCPIYDFDQIDGSHYLAMAFVDGETLGSRVDRVRPMAPREAAEIARQLALALAEAHRRGIIHRDLKPANVMIDRRGTLIIMDFGVARRTGADDAELTRTGVPMGTPSYMSPEQVRGTKHDLGPATDIYALGVILYELSTGRRPFEGSATAVIGAVLHVEPPPPSSHRPDLDAELEAICLKAMAKRIEDRYASMEALAEALGAYLDRPAPALRPPNRKRPVLLAAGAFLLVLLGVIVYVVTDKGTLKVEGYVPGMEIRVDGREVRIEKVGEPITVRAGEHGLLVTRGDVLVKAPKSFEVRRGEETVVTLELIDFEPQSLRQVPPKVVETDPTPKPAEEAKKEATMLPSAEFTKAEPTPGEAAIACTDRGRVWEAKGDLERALADYDEAIRLDPNSSRGYYCRGQIRQKKGDFDNALADHGEAIRLDPKNADAFNSRGLARHAKGDLERALADYDESIRLDPKNALAYYNRGNVWRAKRDLDKALADYGEAIRRDPKNFLAHFNRGITRYAKQSSESHINLGCFWEAKGDLVKALADYDEAIRLDPKNVRAYDTRARFWEAKGDLDKALADYDEAIRLDPEDAFTNNSRGRVWKTKGDLAKAKADQDKAIRPDPKPALGATDRGKANIKISDDFDRVFADLGLQVRVDSDPKYADFFESRDNAWKASGGLAKRLADYGEAIRRDPKDAKALGNLAWILAACPDAKYRDGKRAVELATKACELSSWKVGSHVDTLAAAHAETGDFEAAVRREEEAIGAAKESWKIVYRGRLQLYQQKKPYRSSALTPSPAKP